MAENRAPNAAESSPAVIDLDSDQADRGAALATPATKKLKLSYKHFASPASPGGRPQGPFWPFFPRSFVKQNQHHHTAYCNACTLNGCRIKGTVTGKADSMRPHLASCQFVSAGVRQWAKSYTKDSAPYSEDTAESLDEQQASSQSGLNRFMSLKDTEMTDDETATLHMLLLKGTISANLPFSWIDNPYIKAAFECLPPKADLPSRRQLSGFLLQKAVLEIEEKFEAAMSKALEGVSLSFDSWTDLSHNQLMALAVLTSEIPRQIYTHKTINVTSSAKTGEKTFEHLKEEIELLETAVPVIAVISDAAGEAAKARRLLRQWKPSLVTLPCFAHQFNLSVGDYLNKKKTDHRYVDRVAEAIDLITWWIRHSVPYGMLQDKHRSVHGKTSALSLPVVTRWGSHYTAIKQLLQSQQVMNLLVLEKRQALLDSVGKKKPAKDKAEEMLDLACNSTFWSELKVVLGQLGPLLIAVKAMESEQTKLDRVFKILGFLYQHFDGVTDAKVRQVMLEGLEARFADYDQPVLLIAYMLNPHRRRDFLNPECRFVSWRNAMVLVEVLYNRFFPDAKDGSAVVEQFLQYMNQEAPFNEATMRGVKQPGAPPERLWNLVKSEAPQLCKLALRLMAMGVNAAGCERIFSQMGLTHTKLRNRLGYAKTTHIAQLRQELHRHRQPRKRARAVVTASGNAAGSEPSSTHTGSAAEDQLMDTDVLLSGSEFRSNVNEWLDELDTEKRDAAIANMPAYSASGAIVSAPLSNIFGSALPSLVDDDSLSRY